MRIGTSELTSVDCDLKEQSLVNSSKDIAEKKEGRDEYFWSICCLLGLRLCIFGALWQMVSFLFACFHRNWCRLLMSVTVFSSLLRVILPTQSSREYIFNFSLFIKLKQQNTFHWRLINGHFLCLYQYQIFKFIFHSSFLFLSSLSHSLSLFRSLSISFNYSNKLACYFHLPH